MPASESRVRVRLTRALFRRVAALAIERRTDLNTVILNAVQADNPPRGRGMCGKAGARGGESRP